MCVLGTGTNVSKLIPCFAFLLDLLGRYSSKLPIRRRRRGCHARRTAVNVTLPDMSVTRGGGGMSQ